MSSSLEDDNTTSYLDSAHDEVDGSGGDQLLMYIDPSHVTSGSHTDHSSYTSYAINQQHQQQLQHQQQQQHLQQHQQQQHMRPTQVYNNDLQQQQQQQQQHYGVAIDHNQHITLDMTDDVHSSTDYLTNGTALHHQPFHLQVQHSGINDLQESTGTLLSTMSNQLSEIIRTNPQVDDGGASNDGDDGVMQSLPPTPPPLPTHLLTKINFLPGQISTQQIIQQHQNLRPITERGQEDKKKEALAFLSFYFRVVPTLKTPVIRRTLVLALYTNRVDLDKRYKQPNDMANLCGAVYTFIYQHLNDDAIREYISLTENERLSSKVDSKKRKRKKNHDISNGQDVGLQDAFLTCIKYATLLPFLEFINVDDLPSGDSNYITQHPEYMYTMDNLYKWETELKDQKSNQSRTRTVINLTEISSNNAIGSSSNNTNSNNNNNNNLTSTTNNSINNNNTNNSNINNTTNSMGININYSNNINNSLMMTNLMNRINLPVNVTETNDSYIIYAFIPFYKPNALRITVNQMDITLEGTISLPDTIQIPNGTEILVPNIGLHGCTQQDIQEGNFYKVIKLSSPIASSTVGKRDGVVVIIAKKEEGQTTIHQL
ncbi:hypothetical protein SAMD00019534_067350 [Acytostelium subglobosum LB1]|uniref:hypothetical protein n=1 Tax=Acytostelium subglobosum LB1 TaxID=1410327 RepID=UPI000644E1C8|nr:hypothetical protein SAMD00019534_067350 [Acytostelium subglobosum LB1]GAM23560.1 hypothetical protein SAMD00019534_067350 [Acytostelium subglobosum LB1]|eukprot:XP_012753301.1 hypothetical protein SAMD00019534_067350 [Acytostelium subglobosum LB1]